MTFFFLSKSQTLNQPYLLYILATTSVEWMPKRFVYNVRITSSHDEIGPVFERFVGQKLLRTAQYCNHCSYLRAAIFIHLQIKLKGPACCVKYRGMREEELLQTHRRAWTPDGVRSRYVIYQSRQPSLNWKSVNCFTHETCRKKQRV